MTNDLQTEVCIPVTIRYTVTDGEIEISQCLGVRWADVPTTERARILEEAREDWRRFMQRDGTP